MFQKFHFIFAIDTDKLHFASRHDKLAVLLT